MRRSLSRGECRPTALRFVSRTLRRSTRDFILGRPSVDSDRESKNSGASTQEVGILRSSDEADAERIAELARTLHDAATVSQTADQVTAYARDQLDADYASITLIRRGGRLETVAPTDPIAVEIDRLQYALDEGICRDSSWDSETLVVRDLGTDPRWPHWGPRAAELGVTSMIAAALTHTDGRRLGSVNLFWAGQQSLSGSDVAYAQLFARHAALALTSAMTVENLSTALDTRKRIGQAQGILMVTYDLDEDQAFEVLRRYSQDRNVKLRDLAEHVVAKRALP